MTEEEIIDFSANIIKFNNQRVNEQRLDQTYYDDTFPVRIAAPFHIVRTGSAARIISHIINHIEIANPQVFRASKKDTQQARESAQKVARLLNTWAHRLIPEIGEALWNVALRGEAIFQVNFNSRAYEEKNGDFIYVGEEMPVLISSPDPENVFCWPYDALLPERVVESFEMDSLFASELYPEIPRATKRVKYLAYYDNKKKYFQVAQTPVDGGLKENVINFCPFIHFYSGLGKRSAAGNPETLAVGKLRMLREVLKEECEMESRVDSIIGIYANPIVLIETVAPDAAEVDREEMEKVIIGPGQTLLTPYGFKQTIYTPEIATPQLFVHLGSIKQRLGLEDPPILSGIAASSRVSGRQQDIEYGFIAKKYARLIHNFEEALSATFGRCLQILDTVPRALPITIGGEVIKEKVRKEGIITKEDIDGYYECEVKLNPEEALENDRNFMKNRILVNEGRISWKRFLMEGLQMTEEKADDIIAEALAEQAVMNNPLLRAAREQEAIEKMGAERYIKKAQTDEELRAKMQEGLQQYTPTARVRPSEARRPEAAEIVRQLLGGEVPVGARKSPIIP